MKRWRPAWCGARGKQVLGIVLSLLLICSFLISAYIPASEMDTETAAAIENSSETEETYEAPAEEYETPEQSEPETDTTTTEEDPNIDEGTDSVPDVEADGQTVEEDSQTDAQTDQDALNETEMDTTVDVVEITEEETEAAEDDDLLEDEEVAQVGTISGSSTVAIGSTITLTSSNSNYKYHSWTSSNTNVATVSGDGSSAIVTGVASGTTTIRHYFRNSTNGGWHYEEMTVRVLNQTTFTYTLTDSSVVLYHYTSAGLSSLEQVGPFDSSGTATVNYDPSVANYWVILAKVPDNYLLTGLNASGNGDIYSIDADNYGNIEGYPSIHSLTSQYGAGYTALFGYSRSAGSTLDSASFTLVGQSPSITVSATADKTENLSPGTVVNLTLEVTPGTIAGRDVEINSVQISNLLIGGNPISINGNTTATLTKNSAGRYIVTVPYTITEADCANPTLAISVDGAVEYQYTLSVRNNIKITTNTTIRSSGSTSVKIADYRTAVYSYVWDESPDHSGTTFLTVPTDTTKYYFGRDYTVAVDGGNLVPNETKVIDNINHGTWVFDGWYRNNEGDIVTSVNLSATDESGLNFVGRWHFVKNVMSVTVKKNVTGNMGDRTKNFTFTVTDSDGGEVASFPLSHGGSQTLTNLPVDSTITLVESDNSGYTVTVQYNGQTIQPTDGAYSITLVEGKEEILVTNEKTAIPDTGVFQDSIPYQLLLLILVAAAAVYISCRRRYRG